MFLEPLAPSTNNLTINLSYGPHAINEETEALKEDSDD